MSDETTSPWADAPAEETIPFLTEDEKKALCSNGTVFTIVDMEYQPETQFGPRWCATIHDAEGNERRFAMKATPKSMPRNKLNAWISDKFENGGLKALPAVLVKKGRAYSFAEPDSIPF